MGQWNKKKCMSRRGVITGASATALLPGSTVWAQADAVAGIRRNVSSFRIADWRDHFDSLKNGVILSDTRSKVLQYWSEDESVYRMYPTSVPLSDDLTRLGYTKIIRKVEGPSWRPTPSMKKRNPAWPDYVGPGPENPLGTHALYLSWQYYRIHGTNDTRKIGRKSSNGCIGLYNDQIKELFELANVGTQVKLI
ncbi:L,D-transpeptidase [Ruegeria sp. HKCCD8929]|uniref:L,D-transpeptidase n=1 Tax=Ruegeria sp. HKCCD8929 TaxID=2683006 RepID=UPI0014890207|nr:L,D-transpeptidase [Ruegeria sp. HKCCD8929]